MPDARIWSTIPNTVCDYEYCRYLFSVDMLLYTILSYLSEYCCSQDHRNQVVTESGDYWDQDKTRQKQGKAQSRPEPD